MPSVAFQWPYAVLQIAFDKKSCIYAGFLFHFCFYNFARKFLSNSGFLQHFLIKTNGWIRRKQMHTHPHTDTVKRSPLLIWECIRIEDAAEDAKADAGNDDDTDNNVIWS